MITSMNWTGYDFEQKFDEIRLRHHINLVINTIATILAFVLIIFRSPKQMGIYKWFLFNISVWSYFLDFNMNFIIVPFFLFPAPALIILGIAKDGGWTYAFMFLTLCLSACGSSIIIAIYYRYRTISDKSTKIFSKKSAFGGIFLFHLLSAIPCLIGSFLGLLSKSLNPDQWRSFFLDNYPCDDVGNYMLYCLDTDTYNEHNTYNLCSFDGVILGSWNGNIFLAAVIIEFIIYVFIVFGGSFYVYRCLKRQTNKMTNNDYSYERKLIVALIAQAIVPFICLALPYIISIVRIFCAIKGSHMLTEVLFQISTLHSFFNTLSMILSIKPYREAALTLRYFQDSQSRIRHLSNANATQLLCVNVAATVRRFELNDISTSGNQNTQQITRNVIVIRSKDL